MSIPKYTVTSCLAVISMLPYLSLSMPSFTEGSNIQAQDECPPGPNGPNYQILLAGDTCQTLAEKFNTSTLQIANINHASADCRHNFTAGHRVCIPPPCNAYTVQTGDTCQKIVDAQGVDGGLDTFYNANPGIHKPSCNNLIAGYNVCLTSPTTTTTTTNTTAATAAVAETHCPKPSTVTVTVTPAPTAAPAAKKNCTKTYTAIVGDNCINIAYEQIYLNAPGTVPTANTGAALKYFYSLNPQLHNPSCDNLEVGKAYCITGTPAGGH